MKNQRGFTIVELLMVIVYVVGFMGWIANIVKLVAILPNDLTGMTVMRIIGIVVLPLGAILGFL